MELKPQLVFGIVEPSLGRSFLDHRRAADARRLFTATHHVHALYAVLRTIWGDLVRGWAICAGANAIQGPGPDGKVVLYKHDDLPVLGPALRHPTVVDVCVTDHESDAV